MGHSAREGLAFKIGPRAQRARETQRIPLVGSRSDICMKIVRAALYFFKRGKPTRVQPFRGFMLEGPPATGKTEIAKQAARLIDTQPGGPTVDLLFVDSGDIASPRWGDAEQKLKEVFKRSEGRKKTIILFDDIDCLMIRRGAETAREWHYSINSILFHELDKLDPSKVIVIATTNRPDLIEEALRSRLYSIEVPPPPLEELMEIGRSMLNDSGLDDKVTKEALDSLRNKLLETDRPTIRDVQNFVVMKCIEEGLWS